LDQNLVLIAFGGSVPGWRKKEDFIKSSLNRFLEWESSLVRVSILK